MVAIGLLFGNLVCGFVWFVAFSWCFVVLRVFGGFGLMCFVPVSCLLAWASAVDFVCM